MKQDAKHAVPASIDDTLKLLAGARYLADRSLSTVLFLALKMGRPIFLEGEAGVGKTDGDALIEAMKGMKWESPRGPISIDPETRDIVQNIYIRKA